MKEGQNITNGTRRLHFMRTEFVGGKRVFVRTPLAGAVRTSCHII